MRQFMISAATLTVFAALLAPALAENNGGAPLRNGNQCFKYASGEGRDNRFGMWAGCPQAASVAVAPTRRAAARSASR